jgi:hypothetical protein
MTGMEVKEMCRRMGVVFDKDHPDHITVDKMKPLTPPFMEYLLADRPVYADSRRYLDIKELTIRIYSDTEVSEAEGKVQEVLEGEELRWKRSSEYIDELILWAITYRLQV